MTAEGGPDTPARQSQTALQKHQKIMQVKFFQIPSGGCEAIEAEMNAFLRSHRILKVERELVQRETSPCWAVCVEYLEGVAGSGFSGPQI